MILEATDGSFIVELPASMEWVNEYTFNPVIQETNVTLGGSLVTQESTLRYEEITLATGRDVTFPKSTVDSLRNEFKLSGKTYNLTLNDGVVKRVIPNRTGSTISAEAWIRSNVYRPDSLFHNLTLQFYGVPNA